MKKYICAIIVLILFYMPLVYAQDSEEDAGSVGPEHGFLYAFDIVADNIKAFLSRIGSEETHANVVRRIVAERRAEQLRLLRLKNTGEITPEEYSNAVSNLQNQIGKKEDELNRAEQAAQEKREEKARNAAERESGKK